MPNTDNWRQRIKTEGVMFECSCYSHFMEVSFETDEKGKRVDDSVMIMNYDYPITLWGAIKHWWKQRKWWATEMYLSEADALALRNALNNYLERDICTKNSEDTPLPETEKELGQSTMPLTVPAISGDTLLK